MTPDLRLQCRACGWRPPEPTVLEAVRLHFNVEHDTDAIELELVAICPNDDAVMDFDRSVAGPNGAPFTLDLFSCPSCHRTGRIIRRSPT